MSGFLAGMMQFKGLIVNGHSGCISLRSGVGIFKYSTKFELNGLIHMKMQQVFFLGGEDDLLKLTHFPLDSVKFRNLWCVKGGFISCLFPPRITQKSHFSALGTCWDNRFQYKWLRSFHFFSIVALPVCWPAHLCPHVKRCSLCASGCAASLRRCKWHKWSGATQSSCVPHSFHLQHFLLRWKCPLNVLSRRKYLNHSIRSNVSTSLPLVVGLQKGTML